MKTIAIAVDDETLELIDELQGSAPRLHRRLEEDRERAVVQQNKELLDKQLKALVGDQAHQR